MTCSCESVCNSWFQGILGVHDCSSLTSWPVWLVWETQSSKGSVRTFFVAIFYSASKWNILFYMKMHIVLAGYQMEINNQRVIKQRLICFPHICTETLSWWRRNTRMVINTWDELALMMYVRSTLHWYDKTGDSGNMKTEPLLVIQFQEWRCKCFGNVSMVCGCRWGGVMLPGVVVLTHAGRGEPHSGAASAWRWGWWSPPLWLGVLSIPLCGRQSLLTKGTQWALEM